MSCVVGLIHNDDIWIGADSRTSTEYGTIRYSSLKKMFRNKGFLVGFIGGVRCGQVLESYFFSPPKNIFDWPDAIRDLYKEKGCMNSAENGTEFTENNFLIGFENKLYEILSDFQLNEVAEFAAIGSGSDFAYGSLYTTSLNSKIPPQKRVHLALESACKFVSSCAPPYIIEKV